MTDTVLCELHAIRDRIDRACRVVQALAAENIDKARAEGIAQAHLLAGACNGDMEDEPLPVQAIGGVSMEEAARNLRRLQS